MATFIVSVLFVLSLILMTTTVFPHIDVPALLVALSSALALVLLVAGALYLRALRRRPGPDPVERERRDTWRMPPLALLERPDVDAGSHARRCTSCTATSSWRWPCSGEGGPGLG